MLVTVLAASLLVASHRSATEQRAWVRVANGPKFYMLKHTKAKFLLFKK
jgi:hypothetical protein